MPQDFKTLQAQWYSKLAETGFKDAEDTSRTDRPLKTWHAHDVREKCKSLDVFLANQAYYQQAAEFLKTYNFKTAHEMVVWQLHSEGFSVREISKQLQKYFFASSSKTNVGFIIQKLKTYMKCGI